MSKFNCSVLLICAFAYTLVVSFNAIEPSYILPLLFVMICEYQNLFKILKKLLFLNLFIVMIFLVLALQGNMEEAVTIYVRTNMIILFNLILFSHSNGFDIVRALNELKFPKKLTSSVYFTLKMIQTLTQEFKKIKMTLKSRGFRANTSLFTYQTYGNLFGHIFVKSIMKSNALKDSFTLRGFNGRIYLINNNSFSIYDAVLVLFIVLMVIIKGLL